MEKEEMLSAIYDEMADKTLSQWCKVFYDTDECLVWDLVLTNDDCLWEPQIIESIIEEEGYDIIWHPVRIGDVIEYVRLKNIWNINPITDEWDYPRLPINEQSDDAISFVYNLIKK